VNRHRPGLATGALAVVAFLVAACGANATPPPTQPPASQHAEDLAATIPTTIGDVALTVRSGDLASLKDDIPDYDQLVAALNNASIQPSDVIGAVGTPTAGGTEPRVSGLRIVQAPPGGIGMLGWVTVWAQSIPGATLTGTNLAGKPVTAVTFSDGTTPLYYYLYDANPLDNDPADTLYFVRTSDEALATSAFQQLP